LWIPLAPVLGLIIYFRFWPPDLPLEILSPMPLVMVGEAGWGPAGEHHRFRPGLWSLEFVATALTMSLLAAVVLRITRNRATINRVDRSVALFGLSTSVMLIAPFLAGHFYERYLIPVLPFVLLSLVTLTSPVRLPATQVWQTLVTGGGILLLIFFSVVAILFAHDGMVWNRVRWQAVDFLVREKGIDPGKIEGGLSVNGWYLFPVDGPLRKRYVNSVFEKGQWWRNDEADYIVALSKPARLELKLSQAQRPSGEGLDIAWKESFAGWLPGAAGDVLVCRGALCREIFLRK
jgi:hypothetical protein